jgi:hypothetical protein
MNHVGSNLIEELDPRVLPYLSRLGRITAGRDPHALALDSRVDNAHFGLIASGGRQIRPGRFRADFARFVPELRLRHWSTLKAYGFCEFMPTYRPNLSALNCGKPNNSVDRLI